MNAYTPLMTFSTDLVLNLDTVARGEHRRSGQDPGPVAISGELERLADGGLRFGFETMVVADPLQVCGTAVSRNGRLVITELTVRMTPAWQDFEDTTRRTTYEEHLESLGPGITSNTLRAVHTGRLTAWIRAAMANAVAGLEGTDRTRAMVGDEPHPRPTYEFMEDLRAEALKPTPGRRGRGDDFYRQVAELYLQLQEEGWARGILGEMATRLDRPRETVSTWVNEARMRPVLSVATPGRAGRTAGPRLRDDRGPSSRLNNPRGGEE